MSGVFRPVQLIIILNLETTPFNSLQIEFPSSLYNFVFYSTEVNLNNKI